MQTVSSAFLAAASRSHTIATSATLLDRTSGDEVALEVTGGTVTGDRTRDVLRTCSVTLTDPTGTLTPTSATDLLAPFGNELELRRGIVIAGVAETVPLGVFRLTDLEVRDTADGLVIGLAASDRSLVVARNRWVDPYVIASGTPVDEAIVALLTDRYPDVETNLPTIDTTLPRTVFDSGPSSNPWNDARELARVAGYELSFGPDGVAVVTQPTTPDSTPAVTYADGDRSVLLELSRRNSTAASVYNGVVATGEGTGLETPVRGEAWDDDPGSPTYRLGKFGQVPMFWTSPLLTTEEQATTAAQARLDGILGASETVEFGQIVNPALEPNDVVRITRERAGLDGVNVVLDSVTIPLSAAEPMRSAGRRPFL